MNDKPALIIHLDAAELAVRLLELFSDTERPEGMTAKEAFQDAQNQNPKGAKLMKMASLIALDYFKEQSEKAQKVN